MADMEMGRREYARLKERNLVCRCWFNSMVVLVLVVLSVDLDVCWAQSLKDAVAYLNNVEVEVMRVAAKTTENFVNTCDLVESCGSSCSRQSCEPLEGDLDLLTCKNVALNSACSDSTGKLGCSQLRVTLAKSYVRVPTSPNVTLISAANHTICSQRMLDPVFLNISRLHNSAINLTSWFYVGSVEGVQRSFPGRDVSRTRCLFEPRKRPWYLGAIAVRKDLVILLDGGNSMGGVLPGDFFTSRDTFTKFTASVNMIKELLDTLTYGDRVSVVLFSSSSTANLLMTLTYTGNEADTRPLKSSLDALSVDATQGASNLLSGLTTANKTFSSTAKALKILLLITDGQFTDTTRLSTLNSTLNSTVTLIYSFDRSEQASAALSQLACSINGFYNRIEHSVTNPLWTLRSYFGIMAWWRMKAVDYRPYWMKPYNDSGGLSQVITVAYPVFAPDNFTLIGVVGSDVLMTELGNLDTTGFSSALIGRATDDPLTVAPEPLPCNVQLSTLNICQSVTASVNPLCPANDTSNVSFEERVCTCPPQCKAPQMSKKKKSSVSPVVAGVGSALAVILLTLLAIYCYTKRSRKIENQASELASTILSPRKGSMSTSASGGKGWRCFGSSSCLESSSSVRNVAMSNSTFPNSSTRRTEISKAPAWPATNEFLRRDVTIFTMKELEDATNNWSRSALLGAGGCGSVYRGTLHGATRAIKKPHPGVELSHSTFEKELDLLSTLNHRSLVRLIGYCDQEHILVFEYMKHGTLEDCLHRNHLGRRLTWAERLRIATGAAKGLEYLHEYATTTIIHGDVKPGNILLDANLEPHIADFGLSFSVRDQDVSALWASKMGGTPGYLDPEYAALGTLTPKSDVYSFGIVLLEILSGRKVVQSNRNITSWAAEMYEQEVDKVLDPNLEAPRGVECFRSIIALALQCVKLQRRYRPKMKDVFAKLSGAALDWQRSEEEGGSGEGEVKHTSRRQHPQYWPPSLEISEDLVHDHVDSVLKMID